MKDYISDTADPLGTYSGDPATLFYTSSFSLEVEVLPPIPDYQEPENVAPYLLPEPGDLEIELGSDIFQYFLGEIRDPDIGQTISVNVTVE